MHPNDGAGIDIGAAVKLFLDFRSGAFQPVKLAQPAHLHNCSASLILT